VKDGSRLWRTKRFWGVLLLAALALAWVAFSSLHQTSGRSPNSSYGEVQASGVQVPLVTVVRPIRRSATTSITLPASVDALNQATLYSQVAGYLQRITVDKGDRVGAGAELAQIEVPEVEERYQSALAAVQEAQAEELRAQAQLKLKELTYKRLAEVRRLKPEVLPQQEVDSAQSAYQVAEGDLELAKAKVKLARADVRRLDVLRRFATIRAPFDGIVTARYVDPGALIRQGSNAAGRPIVTVADINTVRVYVYVPETEVRLVRTGKTAALVFDGLPGRKFLGRITRFADALNPQTRTMKTEIDLPNPFHQILPGMYGNATLRLASQPNALFVPDASLHRDSDGASFVYTVADGRIHMARVRTGSDDGNLVQVTGLNGNEDVVVGSAASLQNGMPVKPVQEQSSTGPASGGSK
jgi:membrane fusion protein (multidrug efflux system)